MEDRCAANDTSGKLLGCAESVPGRWFGPGWVALPADLAEAISACLAKDPLDRPTAADIILALAIELQLGPASLDDTEPGMHRAVAAPRRALPQVQSSTQRWVPVWRHVQADDSFQPSVPPTAVLDGSTAADRWDRLVRPSFALRAPRRAMLEPWPMCPSGVR